MNNKIDYKSVIGSNNNKRISIILIADDVATMKEKTDEGIIRIRRWIKISVQEVRKLANLIEEYSEINPRGQNLKSKPAKQMDLTLTGDGRDIFHYLNRGISISAYDCSVKNIKDKKEVTIIFADPNEHGTFDGLHSLKILLRALLNNKILGEKHVMLEVFTGVEDILFELARARNTSTQVKEKSLANLEGKFNFLKEGLKDECFFDNISWVENDEGDISINFIIQILTAFNRKLNHKSMPKTYSGAGSCETAYIREYDNNILEDNIYYKLSPLYSDIFKFVDYVLVSLPLIYNKNGYETDRGIFGKLRGITYKSDFYPLLFTPANKKISYKIPNAFYFPILAAMRQLYQENEQGLFEWIVDPITVFDAIGEKLVTKVMGFYFEKNGFVNEMGKSLALWIDTYEIVNSYLNDYLKELEIENLKKKLASLQA